MNEKKQENLRLSKGEAIKILIRIRYAKKPQRFEKIIKFINSLDNRNPIPPILKKKLRKDIPCLVLLNYFINPKFHFNTTDELINSQVSFLTTMISRIQVVCHRSPTTDIFWLFVKNIICYFRDPSQYQLLHKFFSTITKSQDEMKFLLSFTDENILFKPIEYYQPELPAPAESRDDYINFLQLIGIDTTPIDSRFEYKKPKVTKSLETYFNSCDDFADLTTLKIVSHSYRDKSFLIENDKSSNSTPLIDFVANHRYINLLIDPIKEKKPNCDSAIANIFYATSGDLQELEYKISLLEQSFFELKKHFNISNESFEFLKIEKNESKTDEDEHLSVVKNKSIKPFFMQDHWRIDRIIKILYGKKIFPQIKRIFELTDNSGDGQHIIYNISDKVEKIMNHIFSKMINMRMDWYHFQSSVFLDFSFATPRLFPHPEYCELSVMDLESNKWRNASLLNEAVNFLSKISKIIMNSYINQQDQSTKPVKILMDRYSIDMLTLFSQYYKYFIYYYFYPNYIVPPLSLLDAAVKWKYVYFSEMKDIIGRSDIEENEEEIKRFNDQSILVKHLTDVVNFGQVDFDHETNSSNLVVAFFLRKNNGCGDCTGDSIAVEIVPADVNDEHEIKKKIFLPKGLKINSPKAHKKSTKTNE